MIADLETPTSLFLKLGKLKPAFLLESVEGGEHLGRYSFIGLDPSRKIEFRPGTESFSDFLTCELAELRANLPKETKHSGLAGGLVGAIGYEAVHDLLPTGCETKAHPTQPTACFVVPRAVLAFDHVRRRISLSHVDGQEAADSLTSEIRDLLKAPVPQLPESGDFGDPAGSISREDFMSHVDRAKEYIRQGDIFQVVLSIAFEGETNLHPFQVYRALRQLNPSPYLYYFNFGDTQVIGSSPEALVKHVDGEVMIRPIAGTRPRGKTEAENLALEEELLADAKEIAEHNMLVDLARNDVGRIAVVGSVKVDQLRTIERYSHVMHIVSSVKGVVSPDTSPVEVLRAAFPAGTVSGAPKIRAMQIIDELEPQARGYYSGAVGYFAPDGSQDHAIAIRTVIMGRGRYSVQAGAGIVADSIPANEYQEIRNKSAALLESLKLAAAGL